MNAHLDCRHVRDRLEAFLDDELPLVDQIPIEAHLRWCETCAARVDDFRLIGHHVRRSVAGAVDDDGALASMRRAVVARVRSEREQSVAWRLRAAFDDRRFVWPAIGATLAVVFCVGVALAVLRVAGDERPESLATMIGTLSRPGSEANPLVPVMAPSIEGNSRYGRPFENRSSGGISIPRVIDDGALPGAPASDESEFTVAAVVSRDGRIANYSVLRSSESTPRPGRHSGVEQAVRQSRFRPAQMPTGEVVAVNMIWLIVHQTVKGTFALEPEGPADPPRRNGPGVAPADVLPPAPAAGVAARPASPTA